MEIKLLTENVDRIILTLTTLVSTGWALIEKRSNQKLKSVEVRRAEIEADKDVYASFRDIARDLKTEWSEMKGKLKECEEGREKIESELDAVRAENRKLHSEVADLRKAVQDLSDIIANRMEDRGLPKPIPRPHNPDLVK